MSSYSTKTVLSRTHTVKTIYLWFSTSGPELLDHRVKLEILDEWKVGRWGVIFNNCEFKRER